MAATQAEPTVVVRTGRAGRACAVHAPAHRELHGVWGGLSEADRRHRLTSR